LGLPPFLEQGRILKGLFKLARKDPQKTAAVMVVAILGIGSLILWLGYLRRAEIAQPQVLAIQKKPTTQRIISSMADDSEIIQANSLALERRRATLKELAESRAASRGRVRSQDRASTFEAALRRALGEKQVPLQNPSPTTRPAPTTAPTSVATPR